MSEPPPPGSLERLIEALALRVEAEARRVELVEARVVPLLERIAAALEAGRAGPMPASVAVDAARSAAIAGFREALRLGDWDRAEAVVDGFSPEGPDHPRLQEELARARTVALDDLRAQLDASQKANDPESAIGLRDRMAPLLAGEPLRELDRSMAKWLMGLIHRRLRGGTIRPDVAQLAATVADRFGATTEGASLRASLPTLRRSAGLCPLCGEPHVGDEDACPKCRAEAAASPPPPSGFEAPADDEEEPVEAEPLDLNNERNWAGPPGFSPPELDEAPGRGKDG